MTNPNSLIPVIAGSGRWQFWIDRGGTFTDVVGRRPEPAAAIRW